MGKLAEGTYNNAFLLRTDRNQEVIARIPHPNVDPTQLVTANEVGTMDYARNVLKILVPRVLDWSTRSGEDRDRLHSSWRRPVVSRPIQYGTR